MRYELPEEIIKHVENVLNNEEVNQDHIDGASIVLDAFGYSIVQMSDGEYIVVEIEEP